MSSLGVGNGYTNDGGAIASGVSSYAGGKATIVGLNMNPGQTKEQAINAQLDMNQPVMVNVPYNGDANGHWVVITGYKASGHYPINDPGGLRATNLGTYGDEAAVSGMRIVRPASSYQRQQSIVAHSPVELLVIDPLGRKTGFDATTNGIKNEIPDSSYYIDYPIIDQESGLPIGEPEKVLNIVLPLVGRYEFYAFGIGIGSFTLDFQTFDEKGNLFNKTIGGTAENGSIFTYPYIYTGHEIFEYNSSVYLPIVSK